jgi:hypothetical protein
LGAVEEARMEEEEEEEEEEVVEEGLMRGKVASPAG